MWSKIDDNLPDHPKFVRAGTAASWLWVCSITYANRLLTDGFIPAEKVPSLGTLQRPQEAARLLVEVGLWEEVDGGFQIHDFHDHNPRADDVKRKREKDRLRKESERNPNGIHAESARNPDASRARDPNPNPNPNPNPKRKNGKDAATYVIPRIRTASH
jgi:hypothetical protein